MARILVVEDEEEYRSLLVDVLSDAGYTVDACKSVREGYEAYRKEPPDLCLLDVMLPDGSGFDLCRRIRKDGPKHQTPVVFCTVRSAAAPVAEGTKAGGNGYLLKPFAVEDLLERVAQAIGR